MTHRFALQSDDPELARRAVELIGDFAHTVGEPATGAAEPMTYSLRRGAGVPRYALERDGERVFASDDPRLVLIQLMWHISSDTVERADGYLLVHAGAVVTPAGDGVVILGESGSGKTTLVAALVQEGFGYLSDEAAAFDIRTGLAHPWPRPLGFRPETRALPRFANLFAGDDGIASADEFHLGIDRIRGGATVEPSQVRYVIDHRYQPGVPTRFEPIPRAVGLVRMGSAAPRLRREGDRGLAMLADVMRAAEAFSLVGGDLEQTVSTVRARVKA